MDQLGDLAIIKPSEQRGLLNALALGFRRIYARSATGGSHRLMQLESLSPYSEMSEKFPVFCHKESKYLVSGRLGKFYYNPRYSGERLRLREILGSRDRGTTLAIYGGGIGIFGYYLSDQYQKIHSYDHNPDAEIYGRLNSQLNKISNIEFHANFDPNSQPSADLLVMIPTLKFEEHLKYTYDKNLVIYHLCQRGMIADKIRMLELRYGSKFECVPVRNYCKNFSIFRLANIPGSLGGVGDTVTAPTDRRV